MGTPFDMDKANEQVETIEVYVPNSKEEKVKWTRFTPLIVAIITLINMVFTSITGNSIFGISDDELASYINLILSLAATGWASYKNLPVSKNERVREKVADQVAPRKKSAVKTKPIEQPKAPDAKG